MIIMRSAEHYIKALDKYNNECIFDLNIGSRSLDNREYIDECYEAMHNTIQGWDANTVGMNHALLRSAFVDMSISINDPWIQEIQSQMPEYSMIVVTDMTEE